MGWTAVAQLVAALALVVPVAVALPRLEVPEFFAGTQSSGANTDATSATSQTVAPGETPAGLTAAEWADIQAQIAAATAPAAPSANTAAPVVAPASVPAPAVGLEVPDLSAITRPEVRLPGTASVSTSFQGESIAIEGMAASAVIETVGVNGIDTDASATTVGDRVVLERGAVTEWFQVSSAGLEQGWTVHESIGEQIQLDVAVTDAVPRLVDDTTARLERADGSALWYRGLHAFDADGASLPAHLHVDGQMISIHVDPSGATYPVTIDPIISEDQRLDGGAAGDLFGTSVDVQGNTLVVGAPNTVRPTGSGAAIVFLRSDASAPWAFSSTLTAPTDPSVDGFGDAVAVLGNRIAVGASDRFGGSDSAGVVQIFERVPDSTSWSVQSNLLTGSGVGDQFGASLAWLNADQLVIGAPGTGALSPGDAGDGAVSLATWTGEDWEIADFELGLIPPSAGDELGYSVAAGTTLTGQFVIAGIPGSDNADTDAGGIYIWHTDVGLVSAVDPTRVTDDSNFLSGERAGSAVAFDRDRIAVGGLGLQGDGDPLAAHVFDIVDPDTVPASWTEYWSLVGEISGTYARRSNDFVDLVGGNLAFGRPGGGGRVGILRDDGIGFGTAAADFFEHSDRVAGDAAGFGVAFDGRTLVMGAPLADTGASVDTGAAFSLDVPQMVHTFIGQSPAIDWPSGENWDLGSAPGAGDTALLPTRSSDVFASGTIDIRRLIVRSGLTLTPGTTLTVGNNDGGTNIIGPDATLTVSDDARLNLDDDTVLASGGLIDIEAPAESPPGDVRLAPGASLSGTGAVANRGELVAAGGGSRSLFDFTYSGTGVLDAANGSFVIDSNNFDYGGTVRIGPGQTVQVIGDVTLADTTVLELDLDATGTNPPTLRTDSTFRPNGEIRATFTAGLPADDVVYTVIECAECRGFDATSGQFDAIDTGPLDVVQNATTYELATLADKTISPAADRLEFGIDVDVDGDWAIVGERNGGLPGGQAHVFERVGAAWELRQTFQASDNVGTVYDGAGFGADVAIVGNHAIVTSNGLGRLYQYVRTSPATPFALAGVISTGTISDMELAAAPAGGAYLIRSAGSVTVTTIAADGSSTPSGAPSGVLLPLSPTLGNAVAISATADGARAVVADTANGEVFVFDSPDLSSWSLTATLTGPEGPANEFGYDVAVDDDVVVVAERLNDNPAGDIGAVWVYGWNGLGFDGPQKLTGSDSEGSDLFGSSVDIDGSTLVVGAAAAQKTSFPLRDGEVYTFQRLDGTWVETDLYRAPDGYDQERLGHSVAISGTTVIAAAHRDTNTNGPAAGAIYTTMAAPFGPAIVAIDGEWAAVGAPLDGVVYLVRRVGGVWSDVQMFTGFEISDIALETPYLAIGSASINEVTVYEQEIDDTFEFVGTIAGAAASEYGARLDIADGRMAVGAPGNDELGTDAGIVILYDLTTPSIGARVATVNSGEAGDAPAAGDRFGDALALTSADLWIGAPGDDGLAPAVLNVGAVRRYSSDGIYADLTLRLAGTPGAGFGSTLDAIPGRVAIGTATSTSVTIFDVGTAGSTILGASTGFGNALAFAGDQLAVFDGGFSTVDIWSDDGQDGTFASAGISLATTDIVDDRHLDADGGRVIRGRVATGTTGWADAADIDDIVAGEPGRLLPTVGSTGDEFGSNVAVDGDTLVVTATRFDAPGQRNAGAAYVFERIGGAWTETQRITGAAGAVAVLGDVMVLARTSSVSIFDRPGIGSPFVEIGSRPLPTTPRDLDINGELLVAGVPGDLTSEGTVVTVDGGFGNWATGPAQTFGSSSDRIGVTDRFGTSVAASGNRIVVGAPVSASFVAPPGLAGYAEVWERPDDASPFAVVQQVTGIEANDFFGWSVAIEGDRFVVGAPRVGTGAVLVYDVGENTPDALIVDGSNNSFGFAVDISDRVLAVGDFSDTTRTYDMTRSVPSLISSLTNVNFEPGDNTAGSTPIATSGGTVISGARLEDVQGYNAGAVYTFDVDVPIPGLIVAPDGLANDAFGQSVSIHENLMAVGARFGDGAVADSGAVYIFERAEDSADWTFTEELVADDGQNGDGFGFSVALGGSTVDIDDDTGNMVLAVGAPFANTGEGAVYLYRYDLFDVNPWLQTERIAPQAGDQWFGLSVALEQRSMAYRNGGFDLVVGAPAGATTPGAAYAYRYIVTENPVLSSTLTLLDRVEGVSNGDFFGRDVAIDGKTVVIGAINETVDNGEEVPPNAGALHVYQLDAGGSFTDEQRLTQPPGHPADGDGFGSAVSIDHDVIVAGAFFDRTAAPTPDAPVTGAVYVSELIGSTWSAPTQLNSSLEGAISQVGVDVWVENGIVALSSFAGGALDSGFVTLFDRTSGTWAERETIEWPRAAMSTGMGVGLALSESGELAIGFADESAGDSKVGAVYVVPIDMVEASNQLLPPGDGDRRFFGTSLDADGEWMIVGEPEEGSGLFGPGRAHMFHLAEGEWTYHSELVDPDGVTANDRYARRVALDGDWAAITDLRDAVHIFHYDGEEWLPANPVPISDPQDGFSLALDGDNDRIIIGRAEAASPGSAAIYDLKTSGSHDANTVSTPADIIGADRFGSRVAISGDRAFVAASFDASSSGDPAAGSVRVFTRSSTTWTQSAVLTDGSGVTNGHFGGALDADGNQLIVGGVGGASATIFDFSSVTTRSQRIPAPVGAGQYAIDVGIDGTAAVVGARGGLSSDVTAGTAYVYSKTASWQLVRTLTASDREFADNFGEAVDVTGRSVVVGTAHDDNDAGVFAGSVWTFSVESPPSIQLSFDIDETSNEVSVAPTGIAATEFDAVAVEGTNASTIAASPLSSIELDGTPLSSITVDNTPLSSIALDPGSVIGRLSLISVDIDGGWQNILAASPTLSELPLQQITLAQAFADTSVAGSLASTPLSSIDVNGTPLSSIPLSSIVLGELPLSSIPLSSIDGGTVDWCVLVQPYVPATTTCAEINELSLIEATLAGTPLSSIPLSSIPLSSIDVSNTPLSSIPLSSIEFAATPLSSIPLSSIPLSSIGVEGSPLSSIPLSSIPLSSIPLSSIPLSSIPLSSIPLSSIEVNGSLLSSIPLSSIPLSSIPLSSIEVEAAPLSSIPLSSILLGPLPLSSIPLSSIGAGNDDAWCELLADIGDGADCDHGIDPASTTLTEVLVRGVPLSSIPLSSIPLSSIPLGSVPLSSIPLSSIPLSSIPLSSIPLSSIPLSSITLTGTPLGSIPLSSIPLSSIDVAGSPLSSIPLSSIELLGSPLSSIPLSSIPLSSIPLSSIPLSSISLSGTPLSSIDILGSPLSSIPLSSIPLSSIAINCAKVDCELDSLGDAVLAGAIPATATIDGLEPAFDGLRLSDLAGALTSSSSADVRAAVDNLDEDLLYLTSLDDLTLGEIAAALSLVPLLALGDLEAALADISYIELAGALLDPITGDPLDPAPIEDGLRTQVDTYADGANPVLSVRDLDAVGDSTLGDLLGGRPNTTLAEVWPVLSFISLEAFFEATNISIDLGNLDLGDIAPEALGTLVLLSLFGSDDLFDALTLGELLFDLDDAGALEGFTLADLLLALVGAGDLPFGGFDFTDVDVGELPESTVAGVTFAAMFAVDSTTPRTVELTVELPASASYIPGTGAITAGLSSPSEAREPTIGENTLTWTLPAVVSDTDFTATFDVRPTLQLGSTALVARARIHGTDVSAKSFASVQVVEGLEVNDTPALAFPSATDTIYLTYISTATDVDVFTLPIADNDVLALELSNLSQDFDVALWYRPAAGVATTGSPLTNVSSEAPVFPITDPDQTGADAEPLEDFPRLDDIDPTLQLVDISNSAGTESESIVTDRLPAGDYFIEIYGRNGVTSRDPAALQIQVEAAEAKPECVNTTFDAPVPLPGAEFDPVGSSANTLFLVNERRLEQLHGSAARADVLAKLDEITTFLQTNPGFGIDPAVVSIDGFESVRTAYDAWDADSCNVEAANAVVSAINAIAVDPLRDQLTHVVIVGGDDVIPMARLEDATAVANEYDFRHEFDGKIAGANPDGANSFTSAAWDRHYLSDDPYGESAARSLGNRYLYVTDVALGRLVESPDEIIQSLEHFINYQGSLDVQSATVLGYDFLVDGSEEIAAELAGAGLSVDDEFADGENASGNAWSRAEAEQALIDAGQNELISLNAHFDHYRALPAEGDKVVGFDDNLIATEVELLVGSDAFEQSLLFSMGCHSGLAVPNGSITSTNQDWAEAISRIGGIYVANTGFGYGDTEAVAYTERLMSRFSEFVTAPVRGAGVSPTTVGQALMFAKNDYVATLGTMSVYDEKALMESTFYGLPFYQVGLAPTPLPAPPDTDTVPDADGNDVVPVSIDATNEMRDTDSGTYYTNVDDDGDDQTIVAPGRPIQPSTTTDVSVVDDTDPARLDEVAHGAIVVGMTSTFISLTDPVVATPVFDASSQQPEPALGDVNFPARPITITTTTGPAGRRQTMVAATGQYRSAESIQRLDDDLDVVVYYADPTVTDFVRPRISEVNAVLEGGLLTVTMRANDAAGVDRVFLLVAPNPQLGEPVDWIGVDLRQVGTLWSGSVDLGAGVERAEFIVQAKDVNGNVGVSTNKATNFSQDEQPPLTPPPSPTLAVTVNAGNLDPASGWYTGDVVVSVQSDTPATVRIDGAEPVLVDGSFTITGDGVHTYSVTNASGQIQSGIIRIDTTGAPSIVIGAPAIGASYVAGTSFVDVRCTDPSLASCVITVDGQPVRNNDPLPTDAGQHTVSVTATDAFGLSTTEAGTFTIVGAPEIIAVNGPLEPLALGATTAIDATFTDTELDTGNYTVVVDWGDGSSSSCTTNAAGGCTVAAPTIVSAGTLAAEHVYGAAGIYTVGVTITDETGLVATASFAFVVIYDAAAGQVNGAGKYVSGSEALIGRPLGDMTAKFAFNAKYEDGEAVPSGKAKLKLGKVFDFKSTGYDYLLLGDTVATAGGTGRVDGIAGYRFTVQAVDHGSTDYFRITIWNDATGELVYDNGALFAIGDEVTSGGGVKIKQ